MDKIIPFAPSYSVSDVGVVTRVVDCANAKAGRILRQSKCRLGYNRINISVDGVVSKWAVHRLVCWAFHGAPMDDRPFACHINGDKTDNRAVNLRWDSPRANSHDRWGHGTMLKGETAVHAKFTADQIAAIRAAPRTYGSGRELAKAYGVVPLTISRIRTGKTY